MQELPDDPVLTGRGRAVVGTLAVLGLILGTGLTLGGLVAAGLGTSTGQDIWAGVLTLVGVLALVGGAVALASTISGRPPRRVVARHRRVVRIALVVALLIGLAVLALALAYEPAPLAPVG